MTKELGVKMGGSGEGGLVLGVGCGCMEFDTMVGPGFSAIVYRSTGQS